MPKTATKQVDDYKLTRYACYLIVQNGDPRILRTFYEIKGYNVAKERQKIANNCSFDNKIFSNYELRILIVK